MSKLGRVGKLVAYVAVGAATTYGGICLYRYTVRAHARQRILQETRDCCLLEPAQVNAIVDDFQQQMQAGLKGEPSSLPMLPSYAVNLPNSSEAGTFYAVDLGGTNFRILQITLQPQTRPAIKVKEMQIPAELFTGTIEAIFGFIADSLKEFLDGEGVKARKGRNKKIQVFPLGFTFSFPMEQTGIASGTLLSWTKGYACTNGIGTEVVQLLQAEVAARKLPLKVSALLNDTVGTLASGAYSHGQNTVLGIILGTGTNAAYLEPIANIAKLKKTVDLDRSSHMVINMEWGQYDSPLIPKMSADYDLDADSCHPGEYPFEKMISGMFLGEGVRRVLCHLAKEGGLFGGEVPGLLSEEFALKTPDMAKIDSDSAAEMKTTHAVLVSSLNIPRRLITAAAMKQVQEVCRCLRERAATLVAAATVATLRQGGHLTPSGKGKHTLVGAIDGGLYEHYGLFAKSVDAHMQELIGSAQVAVVLKGAKDGSGLGAALLAATHISS